jgi:hypothetical protein
VNTLTIALVRPGSFAVDLARSIVSVFGGGNGTPLRLPEPAKPREVKPRRPTAATADRSAEKFRAHPVGTVNMLIEKGEDSLVPEHGVLGLQHPVVLVREEKELV